MKSSVQSLIDVGKVVQVKSELCRFFTFFGFFPFFHDASEFWNYQFA